MKKIQVVWDEEIIYNLEAQCPYCQAELFTNNLVNKSTDIGGRNIDQKVICYCCEETFLLDIFR